MPTKQELIDMMENHLPGEPLDIHSGNQPPAYPSLAQAKNDMELQSPRGPSGAAGNYGGVYSINQAPISKPPIIIRPFVILIIICNACLFEHLQIIHQHNLVPGLIWPFVHRAELNC